MSNLYLDPNGKPITFKQWKKRVPAEYMLHEWRTPKTITKLFAADLVLDANLIPEELHKRYRMESINILTHDSMGELYEEPRYVPDEFAAKSFSSKAKAVKVYVDFCVDWCKGDRASLEADLAKEVKVTPVDPVTLRPKDMELHGIGSAAPKVRTPVPVVKPDDEDEVAEDDEEDGPTLSRKERAAKEPKEAVKDEPKPMKGSDAPTTMISDDIGSW